MAEFVYICQSVTVVAVLAERYQWVRYHWVESLHFPVYNRCGCASRGISVRASCSCSFDVSEDISWSAILSFDIMEWDILMSHKRYHGMRYLDVSEEISWRGKFWCLREDITEWDILMSQGRYHWVRYFDVSEDISLSETLWCLRGDTMGWDTLMSQWRYHQWRWDMSERATAVPMLGKISQP